MVVVSLRFDDLEDIAHRYSKALTGDISEDRAKLRILKSLINGLKTELKSYAREGETLENRKEILSKIQSIIKNYDEKKEIKVYMPKI